MKTRTTASLAIALAVATIAFAPSAFSTDVGVSISIGDPGFYGRIDIGRMRPPPVVRENPVLVVQPRRRVILEPLYVRAPPGHQKNWRKFCKRYDACGRPVYFVTDDWYEREYAPRYREEHRQDRREDRRDERRDDRDDRRDDRRDNRDDRRGNGNGNR